MNRVSLIVFGLFLSGTFMTSCTQKAENEVVKTIPEVMASKDDVFAGVNLTVSEGKRLIAKGIMAMPSVKEKLVFTLPLIRQLQLLLVPTLINKKLLMVITMFYIKY